MSKQGKRDFRPKLHFTPQSMWMNDPNGMVKVKDEWHLFYQYHPESTVWGPMHWGHAVSKDLTHWEHLPIALYPDELGMIFSGSCVYDYDNRSGLGTKQTPPMIALYTSHGEGEDGREQQSLAYSTDYVNFTKYEGNPVIGNTNLTDFRDPKMFYNKVLDCYSMVLAAGDRVHFYRSDNLINWEKSGEFKSSGAWVGEAVWECPDLFPLQAGEKGEERYVLLVSINTPVEDRGSATYYFIGEFDGKTFSCDDENAPYLLDNGTDNYASVTFSDSEGGGDNPVTLGWAANWLYARELPTNEFCGQMTIAKTLSLVDTNQGYRLSQTPIYGTGFTNFTVMGSAKLPINTETFHLKIKGNDLKGKDVQITFKNTAGQALVISVNPQTILVDRSNAGDIEYSDILKHPQYKTSTAQRIVDDSFDLDIFFDVSILEVFADNGTVLITNLVYPDTPYNKVEIKM